MPDNTATFVINDELTVDQNINELITQLKAIDEPLAKTLAPKLFDMSNNVEIDKDQLLRSLYVATSPPALQPSDETINGSEI